MPRAGIVQTVQSPSSTATLAFLFDLHFTMDSDRRSILNAINLLNSIFAAHRFSSLTREAILLQKTGFAPRSLGNTNLAKI